jgi:hypothetical protein
MPVSEDTQGATGEPETVAAGSASSPESILAELDIPATQPSKTGEQWSDDDKAHLEWLKKQDVSKWPADMREPFEKPFLSLQSKHSNELKSEYDRRFSELTTRQEQLANLYVQKLSDQGVQPTQDQTAILKERIALGDTDAVQEMVEQMVQQRVGPQMQQLALREAIESAERMHPLVREKQAEISQILQSNPQIQQLASMNNYQNAPMILEAIAIRLERDMQMQRIQQFETEKKDYARRAIAEYKAKISGMPVSTSRAGSTVSSEPSSGANTVRDAARQAWIQMGNDPSDFV